MLLDFVHDSNKADASTGEMYTRLSLPARLAPHLLTFLQKGVKKIKSGPYRFTLEKRNPFEVILSDRILSARLASQDVSLSHTPDTRLMGH